MKPCFRNQLLAKSSRLHVSSLSLSINRLLSPLFLFPSLSHSQRFQLYCLFRVLSRCFISNIRKSGKERDGFALYQILCFPKLTICIHTYSLTHFMVSVKQALRSQHWVFWQKCCIWLNFCH